MYYSLIVSWIFYLANFDDKFAEPIIKFTLVDDIQNLSGSTWEIVSLSPMRWVKWLRSLRPLKRDSDCPRRVCSCILRYSGCLPLLKFFIINNITEGVKEMTTATGTTTPQINDLIGWMKKNNDDARAARFLVQCFDVVCQTTTWNFWRQRELATVNLFFFAFTWKPIVPSKRKCTPQILCNVTNME